MATMPKNVRRRGTDSSGRPIYASDMVWRVWLRILADKRLRSFVHLIVITQGSWMSLAGGGAKASAGVHDRGGCFDLRSRTLTRPQKLLLIAVIRDYAGAAYLRDKQHGGFDEEHIHVNFGWDDDLAPAASRQWTGYLNGRDGLASNGMDYHDRPKPLVVKPPRAIRPPRLGVLAARARAVTAMRLLTFAAARLRKSHDPALVEASKGFAAAAASVRAVLVKAPRR